MVYEVHVPGLGAARAFTYEGFTAVRKGPSRE
jgi:hypothetical protein